MQPPETFDVVVAGGGPAGLTAALVLARARRSILLADDGTYRNARVSEFHGFPGRDSTDPAEFRRDVLAELGRYEVQMESESITTAAHAEDVVALSVDGGRTITARRLLVATGVADELPEVEGLRDRWGKSAFNCPFCDGWEHRDRPLVVLDAAPGAEDLATMLRTWTSEVTVIPVNDVRRLVGDGTELQAVELKDGGLLAADAVFVKAPVHPRNALATALGCDLDEAGFIVTDQKGATSHPVVWAAGDVRRAPPMPHQVVLAAADGSAAGIDIHKSLMS
jgi:thioredoxin reductase